MADSIVGHKLLMFMNAFSGYNQIKMAESRENFLHHESRALLLQGNALWTEEHGSTYQRLVNKMFSNQIRRNMEVHVDDMLVKSKEEFAHLDNLQETFTILR